MEPKDKAKELVERFIPYAKATDETWTKIDYAKQCALICVDELLLIDKETVNYCLTDDQLENFMEYWQEVKQEINNL